MSRGFQIVLDRGGQPFLHSIQSFCRLMTANLDPGLMNAMSLPNSALSTKENSSMFVIITLANNSAIFS